tara:strand:+ start:381 stop:791 length:411 start_codon:yes stop_codon:yes gene_type:complete
MTDSAKVHGFVSVVAVIGVFICLVSSISGVWSPNPSPTKHTIILVVMSALLLFLAKVGFPSSDIKSSNIYAIYKYHCPLEHGEYERKKVSNIVVMYASTHSNADALKASLNASREDTDTFYYDYCSHQITDRLIGS